MTSVRPALCQRDAKQEQLSRINRLRFELIDSRNTTHDLLRLRSAAIQHVKKLLRVGVIVHHLAGEFSPRVAIKRHLVHADDHLCGKAETAQ